MNLNPVDALQAMTLLKQGEILQSTQTKQLFAYDGKSVRISGESVFIRLKPEDFLECYGHLHFVKRQGGQEINSEKDAEYYAWRAVKQ